MPTPARLFQVINPPLDSNGHPSPITFYTDMPNGAVVLVEGDHPTIPVTLVGAPLNGHRLSAERVRRYL